MKDRVAALERQPPEPAHFSQRKQCHLLSISRSIVYYSPVPESTLNLQLMREMDELHLEHPFLGSRRICDLLNRNEKRAPVSRKRVSRLMEKMGIVTVYPKPKTSLPDSSHKIYPYLLRDRIITEPNQAWCADITYVPMARGFMYLVAIMDWHSRFVLSWELCNTMETDFCLEALGAASKLWGRAEIFNTDQGSQFSARAFTGAIEEAGMLMSMDGKGRWIDNRFIERLWRSYKYEEVYLKAYDDYFELKEGTGNWMDFYCYKRPHQALGSKTPWEIYSKKLKA